ncbi:DUF2280 domain-containing protein [Paraburkholderia gardini]|uniref:DUF2280 domain-containing protein n=1 Tax=Paraburkholderia gardini TaxID=2823469 RepID=A0ABM8U9S8_9BURK|nr:DUF2280 domain-containing protein [Paraburkholderia gardini]CAG4920368.1 hypothetical protein R54767_04707 [Paraburkholderia gardini]
MKTFLTMEQKRFVVRCLAKFDSLGQVVRAMKAEFDIEITRNGIQRYDPTTAQGKTLSAELRTLFHETRKNFIEEIEVQPLAQRATRLNVLTRALEKAENAGNIKSIVNVIEAARREVATFEILDDDPDALNDGVGAVKVSGVLQIGWGSSPRQIGEPVFSDDPVAGDPEAAEQPPATPAPQNVAVHSEPVQPQGHAVQSIAEPIAQLQTPEDDHGQAGST